MKMIDYAMYKPIEDMTPGGMCAAIGSLRFEVARLRQDNAQLQYALEQSESARLSSSGAWIQVAEGADHVSSSDDLAASIALYFSNAAPRLSKRPGKGTERQQAKD